MHVRHIKDEKELHEVEIMLFVEAMQKEVEVDFDCWETFEQRLSWELSNDNAETLTSEIGFLLVQEFRKFMYKNAVAILRAKHKGAMTEEQAQYDERSGWYFTAPYPASYYIDLVWKNFMKYEGYWVYCENLCGGYIDWPEPTENIKKSYKSYLEVAKQFWDDGMIQALRSVWPVYDSEEAMAQDFELQVYGDPDMITELEENTEELIEDYFDNHDEIVSTKVESMIWEMYDDYIEERWDLSKGSYSVTE